MNLKRSVKDTPICQKKNEGYMRNIIGTILTTVMLPSTAMKAICPIIHTQQLWLFSPFA